MRGPVVELEGVLGEVEVWRKTFERMMAVKKGKWEESGKERREGQQGRMKRRK